MFTFSELLYKNTDVTAGIALFENKKWFFKISNKIDFLMKHEYIIHKDLISLQNYCNNFSRRAQLLQIDVTTDFYEKENPFELTAGEKIISIDCLLTEYVRGETLAAAAAKLHSKQYKAVISQVLIALKIAGAAINFTHYDIQCENIIIKKIEEQQLIYNFADKTIIIDTFGFLPVIAGLSFSFSRTLAGKNLCANLSLTNANYVPLIQDIDVDARSIFPSKFAAGRIVLNYPSVMDYIIFSLGENNNFSSLLFNSSRYTCIDIIKYLIILPAQEQSYGDISLHYSKISDEFKKIEDISGCGITNLFILKYITTVFASKDSFEQQSTDIFSRISSFGKFHYPKSLNLKILKESMFSLSKCIEGIIYEYLLFSAEDIALQRKCAGEIDHIISEFIG
jgi:hypothetical protein